MNTLLTYFTLCLTQISLYLYLKNSLKNYAFFDSNNTLSLNNKNSNEKEEDVKPISKSVVLNNDLAKNDHRILNKSLRHLEFISRFEMYLEDKNYKKFPIEFLQEFEKIKLEAQIATLKSTDRLTSSNLIAA